MVVVVMVDMEDMEDMMMVTMEVVEVMAQAMETVSNKETVCQVAELSVKLSILIVMYLLMSPTC